MHRNNSRHSRGNCDDEHPGAAASIREGLDDTLALQRLGVTGALYRTLHTTNPIENMNGSVWRYTRNVRRWRDGKMILRWVVSALAEAQDGFRRVRGFREMPGLIKALQRHQESLEVDTHQEVA